MLDNFIYENHIGQRFDGRDYGVWMNCGELADYSWSFDTINNRISRFFMGSRKRKIPLVIHTASVAAAINRLHELAEIDVVANIPGKIYAGDYYTTGFIAESVKSDYLRSKRHCKVTLSLLSNDASWFRETAHPFIVGTGSTISGGTDYPYDYPYDYAVKLKGRSIFCDSAQKSDFRILIYGQAEDPAINIGGHVYKVNGSVGQGETLLIDSMTKTITLTSADGEKTNWFDHRDREDYIFEPIPSGENKVSWGGDFGFDLTVIEKRSEPKWT